MYTYVIGYCTYEESALDHLTHEERFTKEKIEEMVHTCALKAIKEAKEANNYLNSYQDIHDRVLDHLKEDFDFNDIEVEQSWTVFGWASMFKHSDWDTYRDEPDDLTTLVDKVLAAGYNVKDDSLLSRRQ